MYWGGSKDPVRYIKKKSQTTVVRKMYLFLFFKLNYLFVKKIICILYL